MIYPQIQKNNLNGDIVSVNSVCLSGECLDIAEKIFESYNIKTNGEYNVNVRIINSKKTTYIDEISKVTDEKYIINVKYTSDMETDLDKIAEGKLNCFS